MILKIYSIPQKCNLNHKKNLFKTSKNLTLTPHPHFQDRDQRFHLFQRFPKNPQNLYLSANIRVICTRDHKFSLPPLQYYPTPLLLITITPPTNLKNQPHTLYFHTFSTFKSLPKNPTAKAQLVTYYLPLKNHLHTHFNF